MQLSLLRTSAGTVAHALVSDDVAVCRQTAPDGWAELHRPLPLCAFCASALRKGRYMLRLPLPSRGDRDDQEEVQPDSVR